MSARYYDSEKGENQIQPSTAEKRLRGCHDVTFVTETLSSTLRRLANLSVDCRREMFWMFNDDQNTTEQQVLRSLPQVEQATPDWTQMELTGTGSCDRGEEEAPLLYALLPSAEGKTLEVLPHRPRSFPRLLTSPDVCGREDEQQEEEQEEGSRYCLLSPCVCFRCPSAPPYEAQVFSAGDVQTVSSFSSEGQKHRSLTKQSHRTDIMRSDTMRTNDHRTEGGSEQSFHRDKVPWLGESSCLYPSLSLLRTDSQTELNRKHEVNCFDSSLEPDTILSCFHGNDTNVHLQWLCEVISAPDDSFQTQHPKHETPLQKL
ncbi:uncharacterized protein LOC115569292 [Sparus aurata]|uniref:uncharacterized protein LOC115569292 n=1 Tax=Sparus aurata TaxID=8175 RepID=UPI0011C154C5|nr:uncharacterized protein LOC115569292 [Sparus aurata]